MHDDPDRAIISPRSTTKLRRRVDRRVVLFPLRIHLEAFLARTGADRATGRSFGESTYYPARADGRPGVVGPFFGAPQTATVVEELVALGAEELVFFGIAGCLVQTLRLGDLCLVERAFADEGVSPAYYADEREFTADPALSNRLATHCGADVSRVACWTTSALYRETVGRVSEHRDAGRHIVEMELSTLYCVARYRGVAAAGLVTISDRLPTGRWEPGFFSPRFRLGVTAAIKKLAAW